MLSYEPGSYMRQGIGKGPLARLAVKVCTSLIIDKSEILNSHIARLKKKRQ